MKFNNTFIHGVKVIEPVIYNDKRGAFIKIFNNYIYKKNNVECEIKEIYYTISDENVLRGMHFQIPPFDHDKLVHVMNGRILDVIVDIRKESETYGKFFTIELTLKNKKCVFIPKGCAHGFLSLDDKSSVVYHQTSIYSQDHDKGIKFNSFGMNWNIEKPIISVRDLSLPSIFDYDTPF